MRYLSFLLLATFLFTACGESANEERPSEKYEEQKKSLEDTERESPLQFLKVSGDFRTNILQQSVVTGEIENKASTVAYKNIEVKVTYMDRNGKVIEKDVSNINVTLEPHSSTEFKIKNMKPKGTESVKVDIVGATPDK